MKQYIKKNALPLAILALTVTVSLFVIAGRWQVEAANKTYDVILDYTELEWMAEQSDHDTAWWLKEFHDMGVSQVGLTEENLTTLMENSPLNVTATVMDEVMQDAGWREEYPEAFAAGIEDFGVDRFDVLVEAEGKEAVDFVVPALRERFPAESFFCYQEGDSAYILMDGTAGDALYGGKGAYTNTKNKGFVEREDLLSSKLMYVSLGLLPEKVEAIQAAGMAIVPRTLCYAGHNDTRYAQASVAGYEKHGITPAYIIAGGEALLGYDEGGDFVRDYMERTGASLGMIETNVQRENIKQTGVEETAQATGCNAVRVFSMWDYVQYRYAYYGYEGAEEVANCIYRAIVERNIRAVYFKMVKATDDLHVYITDPEVYRDLFDSLDQRLAAHGISRGRASVMEDYQVPSLALLAVGLGAGVGGALLPDTFLPMKRKWTLLLTGAAAVCVAGAWKVLPNSFRLLASFASAVVFACLAAAFFLMAAKRTGQKLDQNAGLLKILPRSIAILAIAVAISMAGAMMTAAPLSSTGFMLEMGIFRGVKAAQLLPLAFFCLLFVSYYGLFEKDRKNDHLDPRDIFTALGWTIPMWAVLLMAAVGLAGYYYLARTGHETGVTISDTEMIFRNDLEYLLLARPRTKEFLVAFPGIMLAVYCAVRRLPFWTALFGLAGTIGLTSVCNTFMHIRTPLYLGFVRTAYSLLLGILVGALMIAGFELLLRLYRVLAGKFGGAERK
ncbi:MAG: hypothetical protein HFF75_06525 [Oscillospiraceae bacterium]|nr:hypothetical protein [Oscillospiraceae bacterium]